MRVIGFHRSRFNFDDGRSSQGVTLYLSQPITEDGGAGVRSERCYLSDNKLGNYIPKVGDDVLIERSSSGAARGIYVLSAAK